MEYNYESAPNREQRLQMTTDLTTIYTDLLAAQAILAKLVVNVKAIGLEPLATTLNALNEQTTATMANVRKVKWSINDFVGNRAFSSDQILEMLFELRGYATLEKAGFGFSSERVSSNPHMEEPIVGMEVTEFIRMKTKPYRETWMLPLIDQLINVLQASMKL